MLCLTKRIGQVVVPNQGLGDKLVDLKIKVGCFILYILNIETMHT